LLFYDIGYVICDTRLLMEKLGINPIGLLAQIINFAIIFWVLKKFLYGPVLKILNDRKTKIEKSIEDVKKIEERLVKVEEEVKKRLTQANDQAIVLIQETKSNNRKTEKQTLEIAEQQAKRIIQKADERIIAKEKQMMSKLEGNISDLAAKMVEKVLGDLSDDAKQQITKNALIKAGQKV